MGRPWRPSRPCRSSPGARERCRLERVDPLGTSPTKSAFAIEYSR
jgi:hypothetical protein